MSFDRIICHTPKILKGESCKQTISFFFCDSIFLILIYLLIFIVTVRLESADPSRRDWEISYAGSKWCRSILILAQNPKSKIRNPKSKIQNPKSEIQNPKSKRGRAVWSLDFGFGRAGTGGDGHVANEDVWPCWPPEFGLVGGAQACNRKVAGSRFPPRAAQIGHRFPAEGFCRKSGFDFQPCVLEIGAQFP